MRPINTLRAVMALGLVAAVSGCNKDQPTVTVDDISVAAAVQKTLESKWDTPPPWNSASGEAASLQDYTGTPAESPILRKLSGVVPNDWTLAVAPEEESGKAAEQLYDCCDLLPAQLAHVLQEAVKSRDLPRGLMFFHSGAQIVTPDSTVFVEPPHSGNTGWKTKKPSKNLPMYDSENTKSGVKLDRTVIRPGRGDIFAADLPEEANLERYNERIIPYLIAAAEQIHENNPFWIPDIYLNRFRDHPRLRILQTKPASEEGDAVFHLVKFEK